MPRTRASLSCYAVVGAASLLCYAVVGAAATALHWAVLAALVEGTVAAPAAASAVGACCGAALAYALNRRFAFRSAAPHAVTLPRFLLVAAALAAGNAAIVAGAVAAGAHYLTAQAVATLWMLFFGYGVNRAWTFG